MPTGQEIVVRGRLFELVFMKIENPDPPGGEIVDDGSVAMRPPEAKEDRKEEHFETDHLLANLKRRTISGSAVTIFAQGGRFFLSLVSAMVLARLLQPADFGLVAMVTAIMGFLRIFNDAGLSTATVQREGITHAQVSNLFWTNLALGGAVTLLLAFLSPAIAWFYREPKLVDVTLALCVTFLLSSSAVQHLALLKRQMRFKLIAAVQVWSAAAGVLVGIVMAWQGCGYWSLVGMQVTTPLVAFVLAWSFSGWRPQLPRRSGGTGSLLQFGAHLTASSFLWSLASGSDGLLIGRVYGSVSLGFYSRAAALIMRPIDQFMPPLEAVFIPTLSRLQSEPARYRRIVLQAYESVALVSFVFGGLLFVLAHPVTIVVLGSNWEKAAPIFAALTFAAVHFPLGSVSTWLLTSQARGRDFLQLSLINSTVTVVAFLIGVHFGPLAVALAFSASCFLVQIPVQYYIAGRQGPVTALDLWGRFFAHLPLWAIVVAATWLVRARVSNFNPVEQLLICAPVGLLAGFAFLCVYAPSRRAATNLITVLRELLESRGFRPSAR